MVAEVVFNACGWSSSWMIQRIGDGTYLTGRDLGYTHAFADALATFNSREAAQTALDIANDRSK